MILLLPRLFPPPSANLHSQDIHQLNDKINREICQLKDIDQTI